MFGRVIYARRRCKARALSVYLTHILSHQQQLFFDTEREYKLCPSICVLLIEILATINLYEWWKHLDSIKPPKFNFLYALIGFKLKYSANNSLFNLRSSNSTSIHQFYDLASTRLGYKALVFASKTNLKSGPQIWNKDKIRGPKKLLNDKKSKKQKT